MAMGSRRTTPTLPVAAAVVSLPMVAPRNTPCVQLKAWSTSGTVLERRPPKMMAEMGTPMGSLALGLSAGLFPMGAVKRLLGCAAFSGLPRFQGRPCQSVSSSGTSPSMPSHHTSPSAVMATLVKSVSRDTQAMALGLLLVLVPGATPKSPARGLLAQRRPSGPSRIHAMSSPMVSTFHPVYSLGGIIIAKFVLPHAEGNAAATYVVSPRGLVTPRMSMCSASHPSCWPR